MTWLKRWGFRRLGGKRGFTLIELLIVMVILAILAGIVIVAVGGVIGRGEETAYNAADEQIFTAVGEYMTRTEHVGEVPKISGTPRYDGTTTFLLNPDGTNVSGALYEIDMCVLLTTSTPAGILSEVPASCRADVGTDNCDSTAAGAAAACIAGGCSEAAHYIWLVSETGDVYSVCVGADCVCQTPECTDAHNTDGFMGVHP